MEVIPDPHPLRTGLKLRCPACGRGKIFAGPLVVRDQCAECGLSLKDHDTGDGAIIMVILVWGGVVTGLMAWVELAYAPPFWVHAALGLPLIIGGTVAMLRVFKSLLLSYQYKHHLLKP